MGTVNVLRYALGSFVPVAALAAAAVGLTAAPQRQDFSGGWVATKDVPSGLPLAPTPVFGPRFWLEQKGDQLTVVRPRGDTALAIRCQCSPASSLR